MTHWAGKYIGKPWMSGARGPDSFDCWGLARWIQRVEFGRSLPVYSILPNEKLRLTVAIENASISDDWVRENKAREGCMVGLSQNRKLHHIGTWTAADGGMVIHAMKDQGVLAQSVSRLKLNGWNRIEFYWHRLWTN